MAEVTSQESSRIISHMNADHPASLTHYLEAFGSISPSLATQSPSITEFSTKTMRIEYGSKTKRKTWVHQFDPPMYAGQARKRLEAMHTEARAKLGLSEVTINEFKLPTPTLAVTVLFAIIQVVFVLAPNEQIPRYLPWAVGIVNRFFRFADLLPTKALIGMGIKAMLVGPLLAAHLLEIPVSLLPLMKRYNTTDATTRALYMLATLIGGFPVWGALKARGEKLEAKAKAEKSH